MAFSAIEVQFSSAAQSSVLLLAILARIAMALASTLQARSTVCARHWRSPSHREREYPSRINQSVLLLSRYYFRAHSRWRNSQRATLSEPDRPYVPRHWLLCPSLRSTGALSVFTAFMALDTGALPFVLLLPYGFSSSILCSVKNKVLF
jgi:hypothetical protein